MLSSNSIVSFLAVACFLMHHSQQVASFSVPWNTKSIQRVGTSLGVSFAAADEDAAPDLYHPNRIAEFQDLEPLIESATRLARKKEDKKIRRRFAKYGDDLWALRKVIAELSKNLVKAINNDSRQKEQSIREKIREMEEQDPEFVYKNELQKMRKAQNEERIEDSEYHSKRAMAARSQLPQFNLDGLWVGKYGHHGYEIINITYSGDSLVAYKVTGDKNVPRGEITFQVNLDPFPLRAAGHSSSTVDQQLQPIALTEKAAKKWGTSELPRYRGLGQVAEPGFSNSQWMDGQLIIIGEEYFSFAWVPIEQQIFFGRPSPELALKMLRESSGASSVGTKRVWDGPPSMDDDVTVLKQYVHSCLDRTSETVDEELQGDAFSCIWHGMDTEECYFE